MGKIVLSKRWHLLEHVTVEIVFGTLLAAEAV